MCRHLRRLERVMLGYLEIRDPPEETCRLKILAVLQQATRAAWPRCERLVGTSGPCPLQLFNPCLTFDP